MLPFRTIDEAATFLGRNLTLSEKLWFNYSATKSDYFLYCHNLIFFFITFTLAPLPLVFIGIMKLDKYKIQPNVHFSLSDMFRCYKYAVSLYFLVVGPVQLLSYPSVKMVGIRTGLPLPSIWEITAQLMVYFLIEDYANYWTHRLLHTKWAYEKVHYVHHKYTAPIGLTAPCVHWAEVLFTGLPAFFGPIIAPGHMITFWLWFVLRQIESLEDHCGYEFPWSPTKFIPFHGGVDFHDFHHFVGAQSRNNFAPVFTYCDYIYGTDKGYRYVKMIKKNRKEEMKNGGVGDEKCMSMFKQHN